MTTEMHDAAQDLMQNQLEPSNARGCWKFLAGTVVGFAFGLPLMYFAYGPKGILYGVGAVIAYLCGLLFLKIFKP
jgi:uncharacterized membrane protein YccC